MKSCSWIPREDEREEYGMDKIRVTAQSRVMTAEYTLESPRQWPEWLREQAALHNRAATQLIEVAEYLEKHNINPEDKICKQLK